MANTVTVTFRAYPSNEPIEFLHPNTGLYVLGTHLSDGSWQAVHTNVRKGGYQALTGRLKNFPNITSNVLLNGEVLDDIAQNVIDIITPPPDSISKILVIPPPGDVIIKIIPPPPVEEGL